MTISATALIPLIQVYDMPEAVAFYCGQLGFEIVGSSAEVEAPEGRHFQWARLRLGDVDLMLNTAFDAGERPSARDPARDQSHRDTGLFFACPDVDSAFDHLRAQGLTIGPPTVAPYGMKQLFLRDPDGYELCFQQPA